MINNVFNLLHSYLGPTVLHVQKSYFPNFYTSNDLALLGGGFHIEKN